MLSLKCYTKEAITLAHAELQNVFSFFWFCLHAMFGIQTVHHYIKGFLQFILWLLMHGVLTQLEMLTLKSCSQESELNVERCKAQA